PKQLHALVAVVVVLHDHRAAVGRPGYELRILGCIGQPRWRGRTVRRRDIDIGGRAGPIPLPGSPLAVRRDSGVVGERKRYEWVEVAVGRHRGLLTSTMVAAESELPRRIIARH